MSKKIWTEKEVVEWTLNKLEPDFEIIKRECYGTYTFTDKVRPRIDAIIKPRDTKGWKNQEVYFGIEFKAPDIGMGDVTRLIGQAFDYSYAIFDKYGSVPVLLCPPIENYFIRKASSGEQTKKECDFAYSIVSRILGKKLIGEIKNNKRLGIHFVMNGDHIIWSQKKGLGTQGKIHNFQRRIGNQNFKLPEKKKDEEE